ncbi:alpha/beta hydrolase [Streptomyces sp. NPDC093085]|uniref:alpha/beta hydrolase n=1 Tax=Streptomyces sp. NPDC093085 TaxID=3155068 RepID=UPI0034268C70
MDYSTLKAFKPAEYEEAATAYHSMSQMAQAAKEHIEDTVATGMRKSLAGEAATAAQGELKALAGNFHYTQTECGVISTALNAFAYDMAEAKRKLDAACADAEAGRCKVNTDGSVTFPPGKKPDAEETADGGTVTGNANSGSSETADAIERQAVNMHPNPHYGNAVAYANRIAGAVREAAEADAKWAPKLRALKADDDLTVSARDWQDAKADAEGVRGAADAYLHSIKPPPENGSPHSNATWWKGLSEEERADYAAMYPASIGKLDGLPSDVRDDANRLVLAEQRAAKQVEYDTWLKKHPEPPYREPLVDPETDREVEGVKVVSAEWLAWNNEKRELEDGFKGMDAIEKRFDSYTSESNRPYLLGFDSKDMGRAIVSIGNPDTADNVVTYVPGTYAELGSIDGDLRRAELLHQRAERMDPGHSTASITWLGYDAPQSIVPEATETKWADNAQDSLGNFVQGIQEANGRDPNQTLLGHSYGSLVVGQTMRDDADLPVDNAILVGSPGVGVDHAKDLNIPPDRVFAATAQWDLINLAPPPAGPLAPLNPKAYERLFDDHSIVHGTDPVSDEFGGQVFDVPGGKWPIVSGELMPAHSQYWGDKPLNKLATIVTGGQP